MSNTIRYQNEEGRALPLLYPEEAQYWEAARRHEFRLQKCSDCGKVRYPIGPVCPNCLSAAHTWEKMSGEGVVSCYVVYHKGWTPWLAKHVPYVVAHVELPEGPRVTANILDMDPADVKIGQKVQVAYEKIDDEITLVQFRPK